LCRSIYVPVGALDERVWIISATRGTQRGEDPAWGDAKDLATQRAVKVSVCSQEQSSWVKVALFERVYRAENAARTDLKYGAVVVEPFVRGCAIKIAIRSLNQCAIWFRAVRAVILRSKAIERGHRSV
jgi:hypothetical protein